MKTLKYIFVMISMTMLLCCDNNTEYVYRDGDYYHKDENCENNKINSKSDNDNYNDNNYADEDLITQQEESEKIPLEEAKKEGLHPCIVCARE